MFKPLALLAVCALSFNAQAADRAVDSSKDAAFAAKVEALAASFDLAKQVSSFQRHKEARAALGLAQDADFRPGCDDNNNPGGRPRGSCMDSVCKKLGTFGCDSMSEIEQVGQLCRGNHNGDCLDSVCTRLGTFGCDSISELQQVASVCRGVWGNNCMDFACTQLGTFGCDSISEIERVGGLCRGVSDARCVEDVCKRLGTFGCDSIGELEKVAESCK